LIVIIFLLLEKAGENSPTFISRLMNDGTRILKWDASHLANGREDSSSAAPRLKA